MSVCILHNTLIFAPIGIQHTTPSGRADSSFKREHTTPSGRADSSFKRDTSAMATSYETVNIYHTSHAQRTGYREADKLQECCRKYRESTVTVDNIGHCMHRT